MYYALFYETAADYLERRPMFRDRHLALARREHEAGRLVLAGALKPSGALLVFDVPSAADVEAFAKADPYVLNGLVTAWRVKEWTVVIGGRPAEA
ncbi:MAG: YciI-like protein [Betaproteobacteria bacterium]